jgi:peptide/nickel transport system ATP-binding protein
MQSAAGKQEHKAVDDVSFELAPGRIVALVGQSGSGKSTVAKLLVGLHQPSNGCVRLQGEVAIAKKRRASQEFRRQVQMVFQDPFSSLNPVHRIRHQIGRPLLRHRMVRDKDELTARAAELLRQVGLGPTETLDKYPHELSGGQRQRVAIARALSVDPDVIIADEPTSMLDVSIRVGILNLFAQLRDEHNKAILLITHDLASARYLADETMVMYEGQLVERGPTESLISNPKHPYTRQLLDAAPDPTAPRAHVEEQRNRPSQEGHVRGS